MSDKEKKKQFSVPIWHKRNLNLEEADAYFGTGQAELKAILEAEDCPFVLWNGSKRLFKREKLEEYFNSTFSI